MTRASVTFLLTPLVLGATGRIGRALRYRWGPEAALWQARRAQSGAHWHVFDPLAQPGDQLEIVADPTFIEAGSPV